MNIVLIGIQGCGKGTLVSGLEKHFNLSLISMGLLLREEVATGSELGKKIKSIMDRGELVSLDIIKHALQNRLSQSRRDGITIFDGFPRNSEQADLLDTITNVDLVIHLNLSKSVALDRIMNRLTCDKCGHITKRQEASSDVCPKCNGKLVQRSDDTIDSINKRFEVYERETYPLLKRYHERGVVADIDANRTPDEVLNSVLKVIYEYIN